MTLFSIVDICLSGFYSSVSLSARVRREVDIHLSFAQSHACGQCCRIDSSTESPVVQQMTDPLSTLGGKCRWNCPVDVGQCVAEMKWTPMTA